MRQILAVASVAVLALLAGACSGGDEQADEKKDNKETTTTEATTTTVAELSDEEFVAGVDELLADVEAAGTDLCALFEALAGTGPDAPAANPTQVRAMVEAQVESLRAIAASEPVDAENAAVLNKVADDLIAAGEADGFTPGFMTSKEYNDVLSSPESLGALESYQARQTADCAPPDAPPAEGDAGGAAPATTVAP